MFIYLYHCVCVFSLCFQHSHLCWNILLFPQCYLESLFNDMPSSTPPPPEMSTVIHSSLSSQTSSVVNLHENICICTDGYTVVNLDSIICWLAMIFCYLLFSWSSEFSVLVTHWNHLRHLKKEHYLGPTIDEIIQTFRGWSPSCFFFFLSF